MFSSRSSLSRNLLPSNCAGQLLAGKARRVCVASSWYGMATLRAKPAQPEELECDMEDSEGPCDGCSFKLGKSKGGPLSVMEGLLLAGKMHAAIRDNDVPRVRKLLDMGADINKENKEGFSPVWQAARYNLVETLRALIAYGGALIDAPSVTVDQYHWSPVFIAAKRNSTDALRILITAGADVNACNAGGDTPLILASLNGHGAIVDALLRAGANVHATDQFGSCALFYASRQGHCGLLDALIDRGADVNGSRVTALLIASRFGHASAVNKLLLAGADVSAVDDDKNTALHRTALETTPGAVYGGRIGEVVELLIKNCARMDVVNNDGLHGMVERSGTIALEAGWHAIRVEFFERGGGAGLIVLAGGPGTAYDVIPPDRWMHGGTLPPSTDLNGDG